MREEDRGPCDLCGRSLDHGWAWGDDGRVCLVCWPDTQVYKDSYGDGEGMFYKERSKRIKADPSLEKDYPSPYTRRPNGLEHE